MGNFVKDAPTPSIVRSLMPPRLSAAGYRVGGMIARHHHLLVDHQAGQREQAIIERI
jgi:hypothetical protein